MYIKRPLILLFLLFVLLVNAQEQQRYFVTAKNGLKIRNNPSLDAQKIGKLPYGDIVYRPEFTNKTLSVKDGNKTIEGNWVKITDHFSEFKIHTLSEQSVTGYVFSGYLQPLEQGTIRIDTLDTQTFNSLKQKAYTTKEKVKVIKDIDSVKRLLKGRVKFHSEDDEHTIKHIVINGKKRLIDEMGNDTWFTEYSGYFPDHDILLLEGGHASDMSYNLKTGETTETTGNPLYIYNSPDKSIRLNGSESGQECINFFFQKKDQTDYKYIAEFQDVCLLKQFYWLTNNTFIYSKMDYFRDSVNGDELFFKGKINF